MATEEIIPLNPEQKEETLKEDVAFQKNIEEFVADSINRRLIPVNTPLPGRPVKLKDVFIFSGAVASSATVTTVSNTASETNLATFTFLPDEWHAGMAVRITARGTYSTANGADTVTIRIGTGNAPTTEWNSIVSTAASITNQPWNLEWLGIVTAVGSSGTLEAQMIGGINNVRKDDPNTATVTLATNASRIIACTAQWSNALSGNTISIRQFLVEVLN